MLLAERGSMKTKLDRLIEERSRLDERLSSVKSQLVQIKLELNRKTEDQKTSGQQDTGEDRTGAASVTT